MADLIGAITAEDSPALFLIQFSKAISLLVLGLVPVPPNKCREATKNAGRMAKLLHLSALISIISIYGLVLQDTISQLASQALQARAKPQSPVLLYGL